MNKSAQGLSLSTVVIGAIVLIVLLVLIGIFSGFFGNKFTPGFKGATEQTCKEGIGGYKQFDGECGVSGNFNYEQVYAKFAEGAIPEGKICCKSSCEALGGTCESKTCSTTPIPAGNTGCEVTYVCCKKN